MAQKFLGYTLKGKVTKKVFVTLNFGNKYTDDFKKKINHLCYLPNKTQK